MTEDADKPEAKTEAETLLVEAKKRFKRHADAWDHNRVAFKEDVEFARLDKQWDEKLKKQRESEGRPCLTINKLRPFIAQVVNDARQNKPSIKVLPQDSKADPETAEIMTGLIRNIESSSDADVAFDTSVDNAATGGFGFFRVNLAYAHDDTFDQDLIFERVSDALTVYPDPDSESADGSDWNHCFVTRHYTESEFKQAFPDAEHTDFEAEDYGDDWCDGDRIMVAEYWVREQSMRQIVLLGSGIVVDLADYRADPTKFGGAPIVGQPRAVPTYRVTQHILSGAEVLSTTEWAGKFIPIIPVYGEEVVLEGKRYFRSLIRSAKDSQVMYNAWRNLSTELLALAPKVPFIGKKGAFDTDRSKWETINTTSHAYVEYDGVEPPQRQQMGNPAAAGALQEALNASDDMKAIIGIYDAGIGARSNETSGRAIVARQRESDTATFHFIDNLSRSIRHAGRILIDLIPKVYTPGRVIRILGEDGTPDTVAVGDAAQMQQAQMAAQQEAMEQQQAIQRIYDLGTGRYDLTVSVGPGYATKRQEAAEQMIEAARAFPGMMEVAGDLIAKNLDWPGAQEIAERLAARMGQAQQQQGQQAPQAPAQPPFDPAKMAQVQVKQFEAQTKARQGDQKLQIDAANAETNRLRVANQIQQPTRLPVTPRQLG
jgi:hypothetical protein